MFSLFKNGITDTKLLKHIDFSQLVKIIKYNQLKPKINRIRSLAKEGNDDYKQLKRSLSYITPNCMVRERILSGDKFKENFVYGSGYLYFDIDNVDNVDVYKQYLISTYGHIASLICLSPSGRGTSILIKVTNSISSSSDFAIVWNTIRETLLKDEKIDMNCQDLGRPMYISYDPELFCNYENVYTVDVNNTERETHPIYHKRSNNTLDYSFSLENNQHKIIQIDEVLEVLKLKTIVPIEKNVVDFFSTDFAKIFIPKQINDGTKRSTYSALIHQLVYLNPGVGRDYIFSFLWYVNNVYAKPKMAANELVRLATMVLDNISRTGVTHPKIMQRRIHFNDLAGLNGKEKNKIANVINGKNARNKSIEKIKTAKDSLAERGEKITQRKVMEISGLSLKTVQKYYNEELVNMDDVISRINSLKIL